MKDFKKIVRLGTVLDMGSFYCKIEYKDDRLSITGVMGPTHNGNSRGSAGQAIMAFREYDSRGEMSIRDIDPSEDWETDMIRRFLDIWDRWHLNDMKAGSPAQEEYLRQNPVQHHESYYEKAKAALAAAGLEPDSNGYSYGSSWVCHRVPDKVVEFLRNLPDTDKQPAWV